MTNATNNGTQNVQQNVEQQPQVANAVPMQMPSTPWYKKWQTWAFVGGAVVVVGVLWIMKVGADEAANGVVDVATNV